MAGVPERITVLGEYIPKHIPPRYTLLSRLGRGAYGIVYKVLDNEDNRICVAKFGQRSYMAKEAYIMGYLSSFPQAPHLIRVEQYAQISIDDRVFAFDIILMTLIEGSSIRDFLGIDPRRYVDIGRQLIEAVIAMHSLGILHRDISPANIMMKNDGTIVIIDFGLSCTIDSSVVPCDDVRAGKISDIYSVVGTLREIGENVTPGAEHIISIIKHEYEKMSGSSDYVDVNNYLTMLLSQMTV